jgi:hypothetical protein
MPGPAIELGRKGLNRIIFTFLRYLALASGIPRHPAASRAMPRHVMSQGGRVWHLIDTNGAHFAWKCNSFLYDPRLVLYKSEPPFRRMLLQRLTIQPFAPTI